jgi:putative tryptophan/tyrosine transport system substrate-binding protein
MTRSTASAKAPAALYSQMAGTLAREQLEILPRGHIVGPGHGTVKSAAQSIKVETDIFQVRLSSDFEPAFAKANQNGDDAMAILSSPLIPPNIPLLSDLALRHRLPAVTLFPEFARAGGLLGYGPNLLDLFRLLGVQCGKVLHGEKPADLPIERPTKFELILKYAHGEGTGP